MLNLSEILINNVRDSIVGVISCAISLYQFKKLYFHADINPKGFFSVVWMNENFSSEL